MHVEKKERRQGEDKTTPSNFMLAQVALDGEREKGKLKTCWKGKESILRMKLLMATGEGLLRDTASPGSCGKVLSLREVAESA